MYVEIKQSDKSEASIPLPSACNLKVLSISVGVKSTSYSEAIHDWAIHRVPLPHGRFRETKSENAKTTTKTPAFGGCGNVTEWVTQRRAVHWKRRKAKDCTLKSWLLLCFCQLPIFGFFVVIWGLAVTGRFVYLCVYTQKRLRAVFVWAGFTLYSHSAFSIQNYITIHYFH